MLLDLQSHQGRSAAIVSLLLMIQLFLSAPLAIAQDDVRLSIEPRTFQVLPGEPIRLELTVLADSAARARIHVPTHPLLLLRAVEKLPVQRTQEGVIVHKRVVIWQGLEPGVIKMNAISVETQGRKRRFPEISITISDPGS